MTDLRKTLEELKKVSDEVTPFSALAHIVKSLAEYDVKSGECKGVGLLKVPDVAIQYITMGPDTLFQCHEHDEQEILILVRGDLMIRFEKYNLNCIVGHPAVIEAGRLHSAISKDGCEAVAITIPASKYFPDGK